MKKLLTALGVAALLAAGCASHDKDNGMGGTSDNDLSGTTSQGTSQDTLKTDSVRSTANGGSQNMNGGTAGAPGAAADTNTATNTTPQ